MSSRPLRADARRNRDRLLAEARTAFATKGVDASLDDIARAAGVGSGTLYRHFPTRDALFEAVFSDAVEALRAKAEEGAAAEDPDAALRSWLHAFVVHVTTHRGVGAHLMLIADDEGRSMAQAHDALRDSLDLLLSRARGVGAARLDLTAMDLLRLVNGIALAAERAPRSAPRLLDLALDGALRPAPRR